MAALLRALLELGATALAPDGCAACDADVPPRTAFCSVCAATLIGPATGDPAHVAAFVYGGAIARAIARFKFERRPDLARPLAATLLRAVRRGCVEAPELVVPVPLHPRRLVERGFNQSALLAGPVARAFGAPFLPRAIERTIDTAHQATLDRTTRSTNVEGAFVVPRPRRVEGRRVLVVDDVRTSGATLRACAAALVAAGAREVRSLVVAQTEAGSG